MSDEPVLDGIAEGERILPDDYPVHWDFFYVCDGKVIRSDIDGTVGQLKRSGGYTEVRNCEIAKRKLIDYIL